MKTEKELHQQLLLWEHPPTQDGQRARVAEQACPEAGQPLESEYNPRADFKLAESALEPEHKNRVLQAVGDFFKGNPRPGRAKQRRPQPVAGLFEKQESLETRQQ